MSNDSPYLDKLAGVVRKHREELHEEGVCICGWHADVETDYPAHLASEIADTLKLSEEFAFRYTHNATGRFTIIESTSADVRVARKIAGDTHTLAEVSRVVGRWGDA